MATKPATIRFNIHEGNILVDNCAHGMRDTIAIIRIIDGVKQVELLAHIPGPTVCDEILQWWEAENASPG
jgi:hypothetical protein